MRILAHVYGDACHIYTADPIEHISQHANLHDTTITLFQGDFTEMLEHYDLQDIGLAFIDSGPPTVGLREGGMRLRHYEAVKPRMAPGGLILIHDMDRPWADDDIVRETLLANASMVIGKFSVEQVS